MYWIGGGWHMGWMAAGWIIGVIVIAALAWVVVTRTAERQDGPSADEILERRYARGDLDEETFRRMRAELHRA